MRIKGALWPRPAQEGGIPLWIAGRVKRATRRAAVHGEAFYASTPVRLDEIEALGEDYRANLERLGKDPAAGRVAANRIFGVAETEDDVARFVEPYAMNVLRTYAGLGALRTEDGVTRTADEDLFRLFSEGIHLVGTPESVVETIRRYADAVSPISTSGCSEVRHRSTWRAGRWSSSATRWCRGSARSPSDPTWQAEEEQMLIVKHSDQPIVSWRPGNRTLRTSSKALGSDEK